MKKFMPIICLSFLASAAFLFGAGDMLFVMITAVRKNFAILWFVPFLFSAAAYATLGVLLCRGKMTKTIAIIIFLICVYQPIAPILALLLILGPHLLLTIPNDSYQLLLLPFIACFLPLFVMIKTK